MANTNELIHTMPLDENWKLQLIKANGRAIIGCYFCNFMYEGEHYCPKYIKGSLLNSYLNANYVVRKHFNFCPECNDVLNNDAAGYVCFSCCWYYAHSE